jgi:hypothetical protein
MDQELVKEFFSEFNLTGFAAIYFLNLLSRCKDSRMIAVEKSIYPKVSDSEAALEIKS